jgi:nucleotide-binding universal stress UspA family protein
MINDGRPDAQLNGREFGSSIWEGLMYKHILIATDGSELANKAVDHGLALAKAHGAKTTVITVTEPWDVAVVPDAAVVFPPLDYEETTAANAAKILASVNDIARQIGMECEVLHVKDRFPAEGIVETAKERGCDLIVLASHGRRGLRRLILGSVANEVVTHSTIPVLISR